MAEEPPVKLGEAIGKFAVQMTGVVTGFVLYVMLEDKPFGRQFAISVGYTLWAFLFVFFRWRGMPESYGVRDKRVQHQLPRLVMIHLAFLTIILTGLSNSVRRRFPDSWLLLRGPKHDSYYAISMILFSVLTFFTQVLISRRILKNSITLERKNPLNPDWPMQ
jgi:hypothetical protein